MKAHILQHVPFEDIGSMASWLRNAGARLSYTRFFESVSLPPARGLDLVVAMGGPMSVNDEQALPWLRIEKEFIRESMRSGVPVLGVCLGAQLIASALGARVYRNPEREIGWYPVEAVPHGEGSFTFPERFTAFHWHGETFDLPAGAVRLARSEACANQAFQIGRNVIGLQFHLEETQNSVKAILHDCAHELVPGRFVQTAAEIEKPASAYKEINSLMEEVLTYLAAR